MRHNRKAATASRRKNRESGSAQRSAKKIRKRNFPCPHCAKLCTRPCELAEHIAMHRGDKQHACVCGYSTAYRSNLTRHKHRCKSLSAPNSSPSRSLASLFTDSPSPSSSPSPFETFNAPLSIYAPSGLFVHSDMGSFPITSFDDLRTPMLSENALGGGISISNNGGEPSKPMPQALIDRVDSGQHVEMAHIQQAFHDFSISPPHAFAHSVCHDRQRQFSFSPGGAVNPALVPLQTPPIHDRPLMTSAGPWETCHDQYSIPRAPDSPIARRGGVVQFSQLSLQGDWLTPRYAADARTDNSGPSTSTGLIMASAKPASRSTSVGISSRRNHHGSKHFQT